jgi:hypothetical protein
MANNISFQAMGETYLLDVSDDADSVEVNADSPSNQYRLLNAGEDIAFVRIGTADDQDADEPVDDEPAYGMPVYPGETEVVTGPQCSAVRSVFVSAVTTENSTTTIYITPGEGV